MAGRVWQRYFVHVFVVSSCTDFVSTYSECKKIDACSCSTDKGEISLKNLARTGKPRFSGIGSNVAAYNFSWNPCLPYSLSQSKDACIDVAACLEDTGPKKYYGIAKQNTASCLLEDNGECALKYTGKGFIGAPTQFVVKMMCDESQEGKIDSVNFAFSTQTARTVLHSKYACPISPSPSPHGSSGLSLGSILVISFTCIVVVYIICGILINIYIRHIEGKEAFPNYLFWVDVPFLVKDGCVFTFQSLGKLCGFGQNRTGYASI
ncbi:unnamed protein product [Porites evermanni]|uniref:Cation-independent mannose-6-phosphate receptor n=1 Tax=Porites evermanni TaxID=104178 RepID=A0ABN8MS94_9CNID|nr:unnamed protein product [Porites evermanni]